MKKLSDQNIGYVFVYTAQHRETINELIELFGINNPDKILYSRTEAKNIFSFLGWAGSMALYLFNPRSVFPKKGVVIAHGDTVTTLWSVVCAKLAGCKVAHLESGLRSFNIFNPFPEELIRLITFKFTDMFFCPNQWAIDNLASYRGRKIDTHGNTLIDSVRLALGNKAELKLPKGKYVVVSIHRAENIYTKRFKELIIPHILNVAKNLMVIFVLHPATREVINKDGSIQKLLEKDSIKLKARYNYFDFVKLLAACEFVITDGGSNQEELSYLGKPTLLMRKATERLEGLGQNVVISKYDNNIIEDFISNYKKYRTKPVDVVGSPVDIILKALADERL